MIWTLRKRLWRPRDRRGGIYAFSMAEDGCGCCPACECPNATERYFEDFNAGVWPLVDWTEQAACGATGQVQISSGKLINTALGNNEIANIAVPDVTWGDVGCISVSADIAFAVGALPGIHVAEWTSFFVRSSFNNFGKQNVDSNGCVVAGGFSSFGSLGGATSGKIGLKIDKASGAVTFCWNENTIHTVTLSVTPGTTIRAGIGFTSGASNTVSWDNFRVSTG